ncbi:TPA: 3-hydroxyacyl-CoA dehydrogenase [Staphylococcus pseudintermedius]
MGIKNVMVAGGGVLGSQIAFQIAFSGFNVSLYDINDDAIDAAKKRLNDLKDRYMDDLDATQSQVDDAFNRIEYATTIDEAVKNVDLVVEAIPEVIELKKNFYKELGKKADKHVIFATNTSTLRPSDFKAETGRPDKFLTLHFANEIWLRNTGEVMRTVDTDDEVFNEVLQFAEDMGMVKIPIYKETPGYIFNSLLVPFNSAASYLLGNDIADVETIDKTWMKATDDEQGPFGMNDIVGTMTQLNVYNSRNEGTQSEWKKRYQKILQDMVDKGHLGKSVGQGFYSYPNPKFQCDDFFDAPSEIQNLEHGFKNITIAGGGVLGSQIAFQTASGGFNVSLYDINDESLTAAKDRVEKIKPKFKEEMGVTEDEANTIADRITYYSDLAEATNDADLVIEVVPENHDIKENFYKQLREVLPEKTYIVTNSSTLRPSDFEDFTGRPEKFAALHFANHVWTNNTGEVMVAGKTSDETFNKILAFARDINLVVLPIKKEHPRYILNSLLVPLLKHAKRLYADGVSDIETIDKTWMMGYHARRGPFGIMDAVGLNTVLNIVKDTYAEEGHPIDKKVIEILQEKVDKGELGIAVGKGFYDYSNGIPYFADDFMK